MGYDGAGGNAGTEGGVGPEGLDGAIGVGGLREAGAPEEGVCDLEDVFLQLCGGALALVEGKDVFAAGVAVEVAGGYLM